MLALWKMKPTKTHSLIFFFCGVRGSNHEPCIYYLLSLSTELSSQRHTR